VGDVEGMAAAGVAILRDPERWRAMSEAAAADARARFTLETVVARYEALYDRAVLAQGRAPRPVRAMGTPAGDMAAVPAGADGARPG
jgi:hypothetical protein